MNKYFSIVPKVTRCLHLWNSLPNINVLNRTHRSHYHYFICFPNDQLIATTITFERYNALARKCRSAIPIDLQSISEESPTECNIIQRYEIVEDACSRLGI